jgi:hypothetical protein
VPVAHLVLEDLLLLSFEGLADAQPAAADRASDVANAALFGQLAGDILVRVALLLEIDNASVVGIVVGLDGLWTCGFATRNADVAVVGELIALVGVLWREEELAVCRW